MESMFFDESHINELKDMQKGIIFEEEVYHLRDLNSCSTNYESFPSLNTDTVCSPTSFTEDHFSFLNEYENENENEDKNETKNETKNEKYKKIVENYKNEEKLPEHVINKELLIVEDWENKKNKYIENAMIKKEEGREYKNVEENMNKQLGRENIGRGSDLRKIMGDIIFLCFHKNGCEYIIKKLKENDTEEKRIILNSLLMEARSLCPDIYGSYVAQSVYDLKDEKYKECFTDQFLKYTSFLTLHTYGCRLIQKSLESLSVEYKCKIFHELENDLITYICHQNGNHVIQKCVEVLPSKNIDIIISIIEEYLPFLSSHAYGCRIVQRIYEIGNTQQINRLNKKIVKKIHLIKNRYGNYVIQKCFEYSDDTVRFLITDEIVNDIYKLSSHKYACNIIEKILLKKEYKYKKKIIKKIVSDISEGNENIINICKDCYGNFMMQKLLTTCRRKERNFIIKTIFDNLDKLKDETYGKYILRAINNLEM